MSSKILNSSLSISDNLLQYNNMVGYLVFIPKNF